MSTIRSFAVGNGDMYYIRHNSDNFTIIDCCMSPVMRGEIIEEIKEARKGKGITRFISTHPDEDHIRGLEYLDDALDIANFYCVKNNATKNIETSAFAKYCELRDSDRAFNIYAGRKRKWMNLESEERGSSGINILWPIENNSHHLDELAKVERGLSPNNISCIIKYGVGGISCLWFGDLDGEYLDKIKEKLSLGSPEIIFAPHHGRDSGKIPSSMLRDMSPRIVVLGQCDSEYLNYYSGYNTITQNRAWGLLFEIDNQGIHVFVENPNYSVSFLSDLNKNKPGWNYIGSLN